MVDVCGCNPFLGVMIQHSPLGALCSSECCQQLVEGAGGFVVVMSLVCGCSLEWMSEVRCILVVVGAVFIRCVSCVPHSLCTNVHLS